MLSRNESVETLETVQREVNPQHPSWPWFGITMMLLPFFFLFIGDFQLPIGTSTLTVPIGMVVVFPVVFLYLINRHIKVSVPAALLLMTLFCGYIGYLLTPVATFSRCAVGGFPLVVAALTLIAYERCPLPLEKAIRYMLAGGVVLALYVMVLFFLSLYVQGDYYDQKAVIETPLGKSNYLAAFLIFLFALSLQRSKFLSVLFFIAVLCTLSRGGLLALMVLGALVPFLKIRKGWVLWVLALSVGLVMGYLATTDWGRNIGEGIDTDGSAFDSAFNRLALWSFGLNIFSDYPLFGIGPNTFRTFVELAGDVEDVWGVHNSVLMVALNYGIIGLCFYLTYLTIIYRYIVAAEKIDEKFLYLRAVFLVLLVFGLYEPLVGSVAFELLLVLVMVLARARVLSSGN